MEVEPRDGENPAFTTSLYILDASFEGLMVVLTTDTGRAREL